MAPDANPPLPSSEQDTAVPGGLAADDTTRVLAVHPGDDEFGVLTVANTGDQFRTDPCGPCPWVLANPVGVFPPEVFRHSARTAYDRAETTFGCHGEGAENPTTCAGFLARGATHNLSVRVHGPGDDAIDSKRKLYANYRAMAIANGVDPDDPALAGCRDSGYEQDDDPREPPFTPPFPPPSAGVVAEPLAESGPPRTPPE